MDLSKNMGSTDRTIRLVAGIGFLGWGLWSMPTNWLLVLIGVVLLATSAMAWCPAYLPFGIKTNKSSS